MSLFDEMDNDLASSHRDWTAWASLVLCALVVLMLGMHIYRWAAREYVKPESADVR